MSNLRFRKQDRSLFREKVIVCRETVDQVSSDCFVNFCSPNVLSGTHYFRRLHKLAGPEVGEKFKRVGNLLYLQLAEACEQFVAICPTSSCVTPSFAADNFKCLPKVINIPFAFNFQLSSTPLCRIHST